jgi:hypothetical protein
VEPSLRAQSHRMPSFWNLRTLRPSKKETDIGYPDEGQTNPVKSGFLLSRDPIPKHVVQIHTRRTPNYCLEDSSTNVDSSSKGNGAVDSADLTTGLKRRGYAAPQIQAGVPKLLVTSKEEPQIGILTTIKRLHQTQTAPTAITTMNQDIQTSPYTNKRVHSYGMPQQAPMLDAYSRPRSRSIAIKRTHRCAEELAASQTEESNERMYDWATWRMYNRIVDHRRYQNFGPPGPLPVSVPHSTPQPGQDSNLSIGSSDLTYDGGVFELEI